MAEQAPREAEVIPAVRRSPAAPAVLPAVSVRYYSRMKRQRVYRCLVRWERGEAGEARPSDTGPVVVRPIIPGTLVVPAELPLNPADPQDQADFYLTPLALGRLRSARVELHYRGRPLDRIPLRIIAVRQLLSWVLLALAFLVPWFLIATTGDNALRGEKLVRMTEEEKKVAKNKETKRIQLKPGEVLAENLKHIKGGILGITDALADLVGSGYQRLCDLVQEVPQLPLYVGTGFVLLAFLSWLAHLSRWAWARGQPFAVPRT
jgi:hypothetical protein